MAERDYSNDPIIERVRETLTPMPRVEPSDIARMLVAVNNRRAARTWRDRMADRLWFMRLPSVSLMGAASVGALALVLGFFGRGMIDRDDNATPVVAATTVIDSAPLVAPARVDDLTPVAATSIDEQAVPVQFVLTESAARTISLVGDFNGWDASAAELERVPGSALWSTTVKLKPGRHVYAFVVDGSKWIRDPRAPQAIDEDFGRPQSVIVVQVPWAGR